MARKGGRKHCLVTMDTILLEVGTGELLLFQGRVVVTQVDMGTLGAVLEGLLGLEHNPLVAVSRCFLLGHGLPESEGEVVWHGMLR